VAVCSSAMRRRLSPYPGRLSGERRLQLISHVCHRSRKVYMVG